MLCEWQVVDEQHYVCRRCGRPLESAHPPQQTRRACTSVLTRPPADILACHHRGTEIRQERCQLCGNNERFEPIYTCALHSECALQNFALGSRARGGVKVCNGCRDRVAPERRLDVCRNCDQLVGERCTMVGRAIQDLPHCPLGRWPGETLVKEGRRRGEQIYSAAQQAIQIHFPHGLGDCVQLTAVLAHLRRYRPWLTVDVACRSGAETLFRGLARDVVTLGTPLPGPHALSTSLCYGANPEQAQPWAEPWRTFADSPGTKAACCLRYVFGLIPDPDLLRYTIQTTEDERRRVAEYLARTGAKGRAVLLHYKGRCGAGLKNLSDREATAAVQAIRAAGCEPILLDWDGNTRLPAELAVANAALDPQLWPQVGDAATLAALAGASRLCIGIDSGPGKIFEATAPQTLIVWKRLHPVNYSDLNPGVTHLVPASHGRWIRGERSVGEHYFRIQYRHAMYDDLLSTLTACLAERLS